MLKAKQLQSIAIEMELRSILFKELEDEAELDDFCDEAEVFAMEIEGKINKIEFLLTKFDKLSTTNS